MNNVDFVTYEQALALKKLGFREECYQFYDCVGDLCDNHRLSSEEMEILTSSNFCMSHNIGVIKENCDAPTLAQAQEWLRVNKGFDISTYVHYCEKRRYDGQLKWEEDFRVRCILLDREDSPSQVISNAITECLRILEGND